MRDWTAPRPIWCAAPMHLTLLHRGEPVDSIALGERPVHLGRSSANDVVLPHADVSGHHAVVYREADRVLVSDLGSSNGTFVDDQPVSKPTVLAPGATLRLGAQACLRLDGGPAALPPVLRLARVDGAVA